MLRVIAWLLAWPVEAYIRVHRWRLLPRGIPITDADQLWLRAYFSETLLQTVWVVEEDPLPIAGPPFEWAILACTFILGSWRLLKSFVRHRNPASLFLFGAGLIFFAAAKMAWFNFPYNEAWFMTAGGLLVATAHFRNLRLCACCHVHAH